MKLFRLGEGKWVNLDLVTNVYVDRRVGAEPMGRIAVETAGSIQYVGTTPKPIEEAIADAEKLVNEMRVVAKGYMQQWPGTVEL